MTDREPRDPADLTEDDVSRLLGSLDKAEEMPADVRGRLDDTLAALVRERAGEAPADGSTTAPVVPLRPARRAGIGRRLLVAAAVLGVVGVGVGVAEGLVGDLTGSGSESATAGDAAESGESDSGSAGGQSAPEEGARDRAESADELADGPAAEDQTKTGAEPPGSTAARGVPEVGTDQALRSAVRTVATERTASVERGDALLDARGYTAKRAGCVAPRVPGATTVAVTYRGAEATLVVRTVDGRVEGRVHDCSLGLVLDGVRIPSPQE